MNAATACGNVSGCLLPQETHGRQIHHALTEFLFNSRHDARGDDEVLQNAILFLSQHSLCG
jgi:hypothetical protein